MDNAVHKLVDSSAVKPTVYLPRLRPDERRAALKSRRGLDRIHNCNYLGSFRGLVTQWGELGLANVIRHDNPFCWWNKPGDILLYDRPTYEWLHDRVEYRIGLFGNPDPPFNGRLNSAWTFWPCWPKLTEAYAKLKSPAWDQRQTQLIFIGSYENMRQRGNRCAARWQSACDFFDYTVGHHKYRTSEYLRLTRRARFGLCLPGYGPKCLRDIEYLALGVVPIVTYGCNVTYCDGWKRDVHFILADSPENARDIISRVSPEQWLFMSNAGREWYFRNSSALGSFQTTQKLIQKLSP